MKFETLQEIVISAAKDAKETNSPRVGLWSADRKLRETLRQIDLSPKAETIAIGNIGSASLRMRSDDVTYVIKRVDRRSDVQNLLQNVRIADIKKDSALPKVLSEAQSLSKALTGNKGPAVAITGALDEDRSLYITPSSDISTFLNAYTTPTRPQAPALLVNHLKTASPKGV